MATNRKSEHLRYRYGICLNDNCQKCKNKEVQQISSRKDFVCEECGKPLRECPPPKKSNKLPFIIAGIIGVGIILGCIFAFGNDSPESSGTSSAPIDTVATVDSIKNAKTDTTIKSDTVVVHDTIVSNNTITTSEKVSTKTVVSTTGPANTPATPSASSQPKVENSNGKLRLSYGSYTGSIKNGYPHGQGRLTYSTTRTINRNDMKGRTANAGDYVIGEFHNGFVVYGKHYDSAGNLLESLNFGIGSESSYDSK